MMYVRASSSHLVRCRRRLLSHSPSSGLLKDYQRQIVLILTLFLIIFEIPLPIPFLHHWPGNYTNKGNTHNVLYSVHNQLNYTYIYPFSIICSAFFRGNQDGGPALSGGYISARWWASRAPVQALQGSGTHSLVHSCWLFWQRKRWIGFSSRCSRIRQTIYFTTSLRLGMT